jgi:ribosomal-protein-alanine N-acetyltransferase
MNFMIEEGRRWGAEKIFLEVRPSNRRALLLYARMGFQTLYRRPCYYTTEGEDALIMVLAIPPA